MSTQSIMQSLLSPKFADCISKIPPEWLQMRENELLDVIGGWQNIGGVDLDIRRNFWAHYPVALVSEEPLRNETIYTGICTAHTFYKILEDPKRVAFMICEPETEKQKAQYLLSIAWKRMREILEEQVQVNPKTGKKDTQILALQEKVFRYLDQRENGALIQRVHHEVNQKTLQVNMTAEEAAKHQTHLTPKQVDERLAYLEEKSEQLALSPAQKPPEVLDMVTHTERTLQTTAVKVEGDKRKDK